MNWPNIAVLVGEDAQQEFALTMGYARLRNDHVITRRQREKSHHFAGNRVIRHVQRFLFNTHTRRSITTLVLFLKQNRLNIILNILIFKFNENQRIRLLELDY